MNTGPLTEIVIRLYSATAGHYCEVAQDGTMIYLTEPTTTMPEAISRAANGLRAWWNMPAPSRKPVDSWPMPDPANTPAMREITRLLAEATTRRDSAQAAGQFLLAGDYELDIRALEDSGRFLSRYLSISPDDRAAARLNAIARRGGMRKG